jgi:hypothetical protein
MDDLYGGTYRLFTKYKEFRYNIPFVRWMNDMESHWLMKTPIGLGRNANESYDEIGGYWSNC